MTAAATTQLAGRDVARHHGDPAAEQRALHEGAALFERGHRGRLSLAGPRAAELLTGLVTNDVKALVPGAGQYAAALTAKGKIVADVRIFAGAGAPDRLLVDSPARAADALLAMIRKFINPRVAPYRDERATLDLLGVYGPRAREVVAAATGLGADVLAALAPYAHVSADVGGTMVMVACVPELAVEGYDLFMLADAAPALRARLMHAGAVPAGLDAWEVARIEAGRPEWGLDMDDTTIPQEANFDELGAISYEKGCYIGQETVARVHFRGHVNRHLRHLRFGDDVLPPRGAELVDAAGKPVGEVRSGANSPSMGAVAIALVRREVEPGAALTTRWAEGEARGTVALLPCTSTPAGA